MVNFDIEQKLIALAYELGFTDARYNIYKDNKEMYKKDLLFATGDMLTELLHIKSLKCLIEKNENALNEYMLGYADAVKNLTSLPNEIKNGKFTKLSINLTGEQQATLKQLTVTSNMYSAEKESPSFN